MTAAPETEEQLGALLQAFLARTLPSEAWTHQAHLLVALMLARRLPEAELLPTLREAISGYNLAAGGQNTDMAGYHESITAFYAAVLGAYGRATAAWPLAEAARRLLASRLASRDIVLAAYEPQTLKGAQARLGYRPPDRPDFDPGRLAAEALADAL
jgi:hypothetical protein